MALRDTASNLLLPGVAIVLLGVAVVWSESTVSMGRVALIAAAVIVAVGIGIAGLALRGRSS